MVQQQRREEITLLGRVVLTCQVHVVTGLHIGGGSTEMAIGGVDKIVVRNPLNGEPYLPGSSLKGKMRSLVEKLHGLEQKWPIDRERVYIHVHRKPSRERGEEESRFQARLAAAAQSHRACPVCPVFGVPGEDALQPTRLVVRDAALTQETREILGDNSARLRTELPFTEVKWEAAIDRVTSAATPRQMERVPAGAVFGPVELVYSLYEEADLSRFATVATALQLVEDDYLGGLGSRGSGRVRFQQLRLTAKARSQYGQAADALPQREFPNVASLVTALEDTLLWLRQSLELGRQG